MDQTDEPHSFRVVCLQKRCCMKIRFYFILGLFLLGNLRVHAQFFKTPTDTSKVYHVNKALNVIPGVALIAINGWGIDKITNGENTPVEEVLALSIDDVPFFDRPALRQQDRFEALETEVPRNLSDIGLYTGILSPSVLLFDKEIRRDWADVYSMYLLALPLTADMWAVSPLGPNGISRFRPYVYYEEFPIENRVKSKRRASFFSGHAASTAVGTFFAAKVYCDYHPELGNKKWLVYGAAAVPPLWVSYWRYRDLAHFPSDIVAGFGIGAAIGILVPHLQRNKQKRWGVNAVWNEETKMGRLVYRF